MSISAVSSSQSILFTNSSSVSSTGQQAGTNSQSVSSSSGDSFEMSSAAKSGGISQCKKGKSTCDGCGACQTSATNGIIGTQFTNTDYTTLSALNAYESQSKYI